MGHSFSLTVSSADGPSTIIGVMASSTGESYALTDASDDKVSTSIVLKTKIFTAQVDGVDFDEVILAGSWL